jgi:hypothetical protein
MKDNLKEAVVAAESIKGKINDLFRREKVSEYANVEVEEVPSNNFVYVNIYVDSFLIRDMENDKYEKELNKIAFSHDKDSYLDRADGSTWQMVVHYKKDVRF